MSQTRNPHFGPPRTTSSVPGPIPIGLYATQRRFPRPRFWLAGRGIEDS